MRKLASVQINLAREHGTAAMALVGAYDSR